MTNIKPSCRSHCFASGCFFLAWLTMVLEWRGLAEEDWLHLVGGDRLSGRLLSASPEKGIEWQRAESPLARFRYEAIVEMDLKPLKQNSIPSWQHCFIRLSNGDALRGRLREVKKKEAILETWYAGKLAFSRAHWQWVVFEDEPQMPLFVGPKSIDGWTLGDVSKASPKRASSGNWVFHEDAFFATRAASIARDLDFPDRVRLEFDLNWKGTLNLAIALFTDSLHPVSLANKDSEPPFGGFYSLQLSSYFANVLRVKQGTPLQYLGQVQTPDFAKRNKAHIDIRADKANRIIALLVDGKRVKEWIDKSGFVGQGRGLRVVHQGQGAIRLSNFRMLPWKGRFDEAPQIRASAKTDQITLRDGGELSGKLLKIDQDTLDLQIAGSVLGMPLRDVKKIEFGGVPNLKSPESSASLRAYFAHQGHLQIELFEIRDGRLRGQNANFTSMDIALRAFNRLLFETTEK